MMTHPRPSASRAVVHALALAAVVAVAAVLLEPARPAPDTGLAPGTAAIRAYLDPETGKVEVGAPRTPAGIQRLALDPGTREALRRDTDGLTPVYLPDGSVLVNLQGRFQSASIARIDENGVLSICTDDANGAEEALSGAVTRPVLEVK